MNNTYNSHLYCVVLETVRIAGAFSKHQCGSAKEYFMAYLKTLSVA